MDDPVYKRKQVYQGFWLNDILRRLGYVDRGKDDLYVRFRCKDGYLPLIALSKALDGKALVAIRDLRAAQGKDWESFNSAGVAATPAPSYLVGLAVSVIQNRSHGRTR